MAQKKTHAQLYMAKILVGKGKLDDGFIYWLDPEVDDEIGVSTILGINAIAKNLKINVYPVVLQKDKKVEISLSKYYGDPVTDVKTKVICGDDKNTIEWIVVLKKVLEEFESCPQYMLMK